MNPMLFRAFQLNICSSPPSTAWVVVRSPFTWASTPPSQIPHPLPRAQPGFPSLMSPSSLDGVLATCSLQLSFRCNSFSQTNPIPEYQNLGYYGVFGLTLGVQLLLLVFLLCCLPQSHNPSSPQSVCTFLMLIVVIFTFHLQN